MQLERDGAQLFRAVVTAEALGLLAARLPDSAGPGSRFNDLRPLSLWLSAGGPVGSLATSVLGPRCRPVRAILFDKSADANWSVGWHQDRTIAVGARAEVTGFEHWTIKEGIHHVEPPFALIEGMVTVRVHLDPVDDDNAPLLVSLGTHRMGRIVESRLPNLVEQCGSAGCLAEAGDVWLYRTAIVHASRPARRPRRRRVLQIDYCAAELPSPLRWAVEA